MTKHISAGHAARAITTEQAIKGRYPGSNRDRRILEAAVQFPMAFGLRGFPGDVFRVSTQSSYISNAGGVDRVMLYTQRWTEGDRATATGRAAKLLARLDVSLVTQDDGWSDFAKGIPNELAAQIVDLADDGSVGWAEGDPAICGEALPAACACGDHRAGMCPRDDEPANDGEEQIDRLYASKAW